MQIYYKSDASRSSKQAIEEQRRLEATLSVEVEQAQSRIHEIQAELEKVMDQLGEAKVCQHFQWKSNIQKKKSIKRHFDLILQSWYIKYKKWTSSLSSLININVIVNINKVDKHESARALKKAELIETLKRLFPGVVGLSSFHCYSCSPLWCQ